MDSPISRAEHEEFKRRLEEHNSRQDKRLELLERDVEILKEIGASIKVLAQNMENMYNELVKQGERLENLESRDGEMWRKVTGYVITTFVGGIIGYILKQIGM